LAGTPFGVCPAADHGWLGEVRADVQAVVVQAHELGADTNAQVRRLEEQLPQAANGRGVLHRDVKPANLLVRLKGVAGV
jgi:hypothetical protein